MRIHCSRQMSSYTTSWKRFLKWKTFLKMKNVSKHEKLFGNWKAFLKIKNIFENEKNFLKEKTVRKIKSVSENEKIFENKKKNVFHIFNCWRISGDNYFWFSPLTFVLLMIYICDAIIFPFSLNSLTGLPHPSGVQAKLPINSIALFLI